uniref:uncharacterized protein LOC105757435 n=1 Tax=Odobenus rosmarus divergens TaxID=9708 RepID=UPI00063C4F83|nr:PREDICTED: uncharacterized protein LOC105757435 [Odobenus rosmarus divergens]
MPGRLRELPAFRGRARGSRADHSPEAPKDRADQSRGGGRGGEARGRAATGGPEGRGRAVTGGPKDPSRTARRPPSSLQTQQRESQPRRPARRPSLSREPWTSACCSPVLRLRSLSAAEPPLLSHRPPSPTWRTRSPRRTRRQPQRDRPARRSRENYISQTAARSRTPLPSSARGVPEDYLSQSEEGRPARGPRGPAHST